MPFCCASIAAPIPEIHSLEVCKYAQCNFEKTAIYGFTSVAPSILLSIRITVQHKNGSRLTDVMCVQCRICHHQRRFQVQPLGESI